jgi:multicomponent K+:H+ antiporter subunit D
VTGTLNMGDMAERVAAISADDTAMLRVGAVLLMLVFAVKASILPLHFWLPETYAQAPAPVAALFAIMTKVGAYAILRVDTLIFGPETAATAGMMTWLILSGGIATLALGMIGVLGARSLGQLAAFATIGSVGTLLSALALFTPESTAAALYYTIHSTLAGALLFLVVDMVRERRGSIGDALVSAPPIASAGLISALWFVAAIAVAGMPPLSGFIGKLLVLDSVRGHDLMWLIWTVVLFGSLLAILGLAQAGSRVFWKVEAAEPSEADTALPDPGALKPLAMPAAAVFSLVATIVALTVFAGPVMRYLDATAAQLYAPKQYIDAVYNQKSVAPPYPGAKPTPNRILAPGKGNSAAQTKGGG